MNTNPLLPFHKDAAGYLPAPDEEAGLAWATDPANQPRLEHWLNHALWRAMTRLEETRYDTEIVNTLNNAIEVKLSWDDYCRGCHMGTYHEKVLFTFAELLNPDTDMASLAETRYKQAENGAKMRAAAEEAHRRKAEEERQRPIREAAERAKLAELKAKYEEGKP